MNYGTVRVLPATGNGVHGYGYGVGKPDPRYTRVQPYCHVVMFLEYEMERTSWIRRTWVIGPCFS